MLPELVAMGCDYQKHGKRRSHAIAGSMMACSEMRRNGLMMHIKSITNMHY